MKLRLLFTTLGPLTLSLLFAAYSLPAHAADVTVVGTPGLDYASGRGGNATAITPCSSLAPTILRTTNCPRSIVSAFS